MAKACLSWVEATLVPTFWAQTRHLAKSLAINRVKPLCLTLRYRGRTQRQRISWSSLAPKGLTSYTIYRLIFPSMKPLSTKVCQTTLRTRHSRVAAGGTDTGAAQTHSTRQVITTWILRMCCELLQILYTQEAPSEPFTHLSLTTRRPSLARSLHSRICLRRTRIKTLCGRRTLWVRFKNWLKKSHAYQQKKLNSLPTSQRVTCQMMEADALYNQTTIWTANISSTQASWVSNRLLVWLRLRL